MRHLISELMTYSASEILEQVTKLATPERPIYLIGGRLRDRLLGASSRDMDFAMCKDAIQTARKVADGCGGDFYVLDAERGIARVIVAGEEQSRLVLDFADLRAETIEADLALRDFSINAMASDLLHPGELIDPLNARQDIATRTLRMCNPACFEDDPVRILRAVRFAVQLDFQIEPATEEKLRRAIPELSRPSIERQRDELFHILEGRLVNQSMRRLESMGVLPSLLPEVAALVGFDQSTHHFYDAWEHTLSVLTYFEQILDHFLTTPDIKTSQLLIEGALKRLARFQSAIFLYLRTEINPLRSLRSILMFSALTHDIGKPATRLESLDGKVTFHRHEEVGADMARERALALALSNDEVFFVEGFIRNHMRIHPLAKEKNLDLRRMAYHFFQACGLVGVADCLFFLADLLATYEERMDPQRWEQGMGICEKLLDAWFNHHQEWICPVLLLNGDDLQRELHLEPGAQIGQLLRKLEEAQAVGEVSDRHEALAYLKDVLEHPPLEEEQNDQIVL